MPSSNGTFLVGMIFLTSVTATCLMFASYKKEIESKENSLKRLRDENAELNTRFTAFASYIVDTDPLLALTYISTQSQGFIENESIIVEDTIEEDPI